MANTITEATTELLDAIVDFSETKLAITSGTVSGLKYKTFTQTVTSGVVQCDLSAAQMFIVKPTDNITIEFLNPPSTDEYIVSLLKITQGGLYEVHWPEDSLFVQGVPPVLSSTGDDLISVQYDSDTQKYWITNIKSDWTVEV